MAKWIVGKGLDKYIAYLQSLEAATDEVIGKAVYEMAKVVADNVKANMMALPAVSNEANIATYKKGYSRLSEPEKEGLIEGFGISPMRNDQGYVNVKLGFDGYNSVKTKKYPNGQPNVLIARVTESRQPDVPDRRCQEKVPVLLPQCLRDSFRQQPEPRGPPRTDRD